MNNAVSVESETLAVKSENILNLPLGLLGFEQHKQYVLLAHEEEVPFSWLQMLEPPRQSFLVIPPAVVLPDYRPELSEEDVQFLGLQSSEDALVFNIVTLRRTGEATVNLKGPIVVNRHTLVAKQVIPLNVADYSLQHALPAATGSSTPC